jgi:hypothetical protein
MLQRAAIVLALLLIVPIPKSFADIAAIHVNALPQEPAILAAVDDAQKLEPYCASWTSNWNYEVSKDDVSTRLIKDLGFLKLAVKAHPDNVELRLLTGLVARYAYNLDVDGTYDETMEVLGQAQKLVTGDFRARWFKAALECQSLEMKAGADDFLAIENSRDWNSLPESFWRDYVNCATQAILPEHALRAVSYLEKLHPGSQSDYASAVDIAHSRIVAFDPQKKYDPRETWSGSGNGDEPVFTSSTCGVSMHAEGDWGIDDIGAKNSSCFAIFNPGPYQAVKRKLRPSILLIVQQSKEGESLDNYSKKFMTDGTFTPAPELHCPASNCIALKGVQPGMYKKDGDGHSRLVVFERDEPAFPGLIFESAIAPPKVDPSKGIQVFRPVPKQGRIPGKLFYVVILDTAASIEEPAIKDFNFFLENLTVE